MTSARSPAASQKMPSRMGREGGKCHLLGEGVMSGGLQPFGFQRAIGRQLNLELAATGDSATAEPCPNGAAVKVERFRDLGLRAKVVL